MERVVHSNGVALALVEEGEGTPVVLAHGLTATRRYVVMGSRALERSGHRVVAYDARGHGRSSPAPAPDAYGYDDLAADLEAVLDDLGVPRAVLAGASMGAHTIARLALERPERVAAAVFVTPGHSPDRAEDAPALARWDELATALRTGGIDGFVAAYLARGVDARWRETLERVLRQRMSAHEHLDAVADALVAVPRSHPFPSWEALRDVDVPAVVVGSRDEADPIHPLAIAQRWAVELPRARLVVEEEGRSPLAWQGGQLSKVIAQLAAQQDRPVAGYSGTPLPAKLGIADGKRVAFLNAPPDFDGLLRPLPAGVEVVGGLEPGLDVVVFFTLARWELERRISALRDAIAPDGAVWVAWPKKASGVATDMTEDVVREVVLPLGMVDNKVAAIDATWSGLRVVIRRENR